MAREVIQVGNKIEMRIVEKKMGGNSSSAGESYVSQLLQWPEKNTAVIAVPSFKGHMVALGVDDIYELRFFARGGIYQCRAKIVRRARTSNNLAVAEVHFISALEKYQRREYYRMNCVMPMTYAVLSEEQKELYKEKKYCLSQEQKQNIEKRLEIQQVEFMNATVLDISGGGMRFNSVRQQEPGELLLLEPALPEILKKRIPYLFGRIISSRRIPNKEPLTFDNRVKFVEMSHSEQEQIITYIFKEERDKRNREVNFK